MTESTNPITPPPKLLNKWAREWLNTDGSRPFPEWLADRAAQWGADQELEACCSEVSFWGSKGLSDRLRIARRPKPLSLKEQSIALIDLIQGSKKAWDISDLNVIRKALEQLND